MNYTFYNEETETENIWEVDYKTAPYDNGSDYPTGGLELTRLNVFNEKGVNITKDLPEDVISEIQDKCYQDVAY